MNLWVSNGDNYIIYYNYFKEIIIIPMYIDIGKILNISQNTKIEKRTILRWLS